MWTLPPSMTALRDILASSPSNFSLKTARQRRFISLMISKTRGSRLCTRPCGQVSSASDMMVWLV